MGPLILVIFTRNAKRKGYYSAVFCIKMIVINIIMSISVCNYSIHSYTYNKISKIEEYAKKTGKYVENIVNLELYTGTNICIFLDFSVFVADINWIVFPFSVIYPLIYYFNQKYCDKKVVFSIGTN